jgi:hypothetical protein
MLELMLSLSLSCSDFNRIANKMFDNNSITQSEKQEILQTLREYSDCPIELETK